MKKILVVEDSSLVLKVLKRLIRDNGEFEADYAENLAQASQLLGENENVYFAAVVDLNLPDAPNGESVDLLLNNNIPTIVLTASYDEKRKDKLFEKGIVDYVIKENRYSYEYAVRIMTRLSRNHGIKVLVVDDSLVARKQCGNLLRKYLFQVVEANGAKQAINHLVENPDIRLVITDYNMPEVDGFELVKIIRSKYDKQDLTIIGLSGDNNAALSAKFIKNGANDFLRKPFIQEEFYCRIMHNIETLEAVEKIRDAANRDYLSGLYNRHYFSKIVESSLKKCREKNQSHALAIIEIDEFNSFNNVHHAYGDIVIEKFAKYFSFFFKQDFTGRLNGTQYALAIANKNVNQVFERIDQFRKEVSKLELTINGTTSAMTVSVGLTSSDNSDLTQLLEDCDDLLLRAHDAGQNIVVID